MPPRIAGPVIVDGDRITRLHRVPFGSREYDEDWLQQLVFTQPSLLPCETLDPGFEGMRALARELPTERGPVDVVLVNERGRVALVECKLWRNSQARREVVAQVMDYATAMSKWSTSHFERQAQSVALEGKRPLGWLFKDLGSSFDERGFLSVL